MVIVTVDLGTTVTKVDVWDESGRLGSGRADLATFHPAPDRAEQDPGTWWPAVVDAANQARQAAPAAWSAAAAIGLSGARQTVVAVSADGSFLGPAMVWSDRRADAQAERLGQILGGGAQHVRQRTGQYLRATTVSAKLAWLAEHRPELVGAARWILSPRDWLILRLTGQAATDPTMASATGLYERSGALVDELAGAWAAHLAEIRPSASVAGGLTSMAARTLVLGPDTPVVIGVGDRAGEVLGSGAGSTRPMVSWGTAANVSRPGWSIDRPIPDGLVATRSPTGIADHREPDAAEQLEGGLSAAGSMLAWLAQLTGRPVDTLVDAAATRPAGASGVTALPWLEGARAPWWNDGAAAVFVGLRSETEPADLARSVLEGVAFEVARVLSAMRAGHPPRTDRAGAHPGGGLPHDPDAGRGFEGLELTGRGAAAPVWIEVVAAVTGCPVRIPRRGQAAAVGAALLTSAAMGQPYDRDRLDPVERVHTPDPELVERYRHLAPAADELAQALLGWPGTDG